MQSSRRLFTVCALLALLGCSKDADSGATTAKVAHPLLAEPAFLDLGYVTFGQRRESTWKLRNQSSETLTIVRIGPLGCQCADATLVVGGSGRNLNVRDGLPISVPLAPGATAELHFILDTARYREPVSRKVGSIPILFENAPPLLLEWAVDIWTPFMIEPWGLELGEVGVRERAQGRVLVQAHDDEKFGLHVDSKIEGWILKSTRLSAPGDPMLYEIHVTTPAELPEGGFSREFMFLTDLAGAPPVRFTVSGIARPDLSVSPTRILFDPARGQNVASLTFAHRAEGGLVKLLEVEDLPEGISVESLDAEPAARRSLSLRWKGAPPAETIRGKFKIRTGDAERPVIEVPWTVLHAGSTDS